MRRLLIVWIVVSFFLPAIASVDAMMGKIPFDQLVLGSDLILLGRVESVQSYKREIESMPGQKREVENVIWSVAEVVADRILKGGIGSRSILIEFQGGSFEDSPNYKLDEEVIVFLQKIKGKDSYTTVGMLQGKYIIREGIVAQEKVTVDEFIKRINIIFTRTR